MNYRNFVLETIDCVKLVKYDIKLQRKDKLSLTIWLFLHYIE